MRSPVPGLVARYTGWMRTTTGLVAAASIFIASFALHIVGGATDQGWLFAVAVGLIYLSASAFGVIAWMIAGARPGDRVTLAVGAIAGIVLTASALWAANDRSFAWWQVPLGAVLTALTSVAAYAAFHALRRSARTRAGRERMGAAS